MKNRELIVPLYLKNGRAVCGLKDWNEIGDAVEIAASCGNCGADALLLFDLSDGDAEHEASIHLIRRIARAADIPLYGGGNIRRLEDVKKLIYAGCRKVFLNYAKEGNCELTQEASARFGREHMLACVSTGEELQEARIQGTLLDGVVLLNGALLKDAAGYGKLSGERSENAAIHEDSTGELSEDAADPGKSSGEQSRGAEGWNHIFCIFHSGESVAPSADRSGGTGVSDAGLSSELEALSSDRSDRTGVSDAGLSVESEVPAASVRSSSKTGNEAPVQLHTGVEKNCAQSSGTEDEAAFNIRSGGSESLYAVLSRGADGVFSPEFSAPEYDFMEAKHALLSVGIPVNTYEASMDFGAMKKNSDGLVPVVVQDYRTDEVLMVAYMNEEAFRNTVRTGRMTYFSRSRQALWVKGETSGHYQFVRELRIDCDNDTLLAKVVQKGAACHTGNRSCFYRTILHKEYDAANPMRVFENVFSVIQDRKIHPREGSYTNYLFDKGLDKILKKVGEEATEIVIAAKNPDPDEVVYEISDFLYHVMVLMAERGLTWEDITEELAKR